MTKEELREHCKRQIRHCEIFANERGVEPSGNIYEEHKLILELLEQESVLDKVKQARKEMDDLASHKVRPISFDQSVAVDMCIKILDKLIKEVEE